MLATALSTLSLALAAGSDEGGIPAWVPKTVNLAIFLGILYFLLRKPLASFLAARTVAIRADLERAKRDKAIAEAKLAEVEARLALLADEQAQIRAEAGIEAETEHARIRPARRRRLARSPRRPSARSPAPSRPPAPICSASPPSSRFSSPRESSGLR